MAYKRSDWNDLLDDVNDVLQNPPSGCDPIEALEHVGERHRWAKSDIREVQERLKQTCPDISFDTVPDKWKKSIIDEIQGKLGEAWCNCDCPCPEGEEGDREFILRSYTCRVNSNCYGDPLENVVDLRGELSGYTAARGVEGRTWKVFFKRQNGVYNVVHGYPPDHSVSFQGSIDCDGTLRFGGRLRFNDVNVAGIYVACGDCESLGCAQALEAGEAEIAEDCTDPFVITHLVLRLSCNSNLTSCCEEEEGGGGGGGGG